MWTRKELKETAKVRFYATYWKSVLAALILAFILGNGIDIENKFDGSDVSNLVQNPGYSANQIINSIENHDVHSILNMYAPWLAPLLGVVAFITVVAVTAGICAKIFLLNPLEVGGRKFFTENLTTNAEIKAYGFAFTSTYLNIVKTMLLRDLYTFLWSLLFIIPGIIKSYEYRMIPYIMAENPEISSEEAFSLSKQMMTGNKWDAFVLDLSFIGWHILSALTLGILSIFYVNPYVYQTSAALYSRLSANNGHSSHNDYYVEVE